MLSKLTREAIVRALDSSSDEETSTDNLLFVNESDFEAASELIDQHFNDHSLTSQPDETENMLSAPYESGDDSNELENIENISNRANLNNTVDIQKRERTSRHENKRNREHGNEYYGEIKTTDGYKFVKRNKREMGPACNRSRCQKSKFSNCKLFTEEKRKEIFQDFWSLNWDQRKVYVQSLVDRTVPEKRTTYNTSANRQETMQYYLKLNKARKKVCKFTFMNTLGLKPTSLREWLVNPKPTKPQGKARTLATNDNLVQRKAHLAAFLETLAKVPSHYCRRDSKRQYLDRPFTCQKFLERTYQEDARAKGVKPLSWAYFHGEMKRQGISVFKPRKDQCNVCCAYAEGNVAEDEQKRHIELKDLAQNKKKADSHNKDPNTSVLCMDVQATLLCPVLKCNAIYYKKKLSMHNFTFYNLKNSDVTCYLWHEGEGGLESGNFASMLVDKLSQDLKAKPNLTHFILYSDGCPYQNRCTVIANALLYFAIKNNVTVEHNYLEKGHTQMAADSVHAVIERKIEDQIIGDPFDYVEIIKTARISKTPYEVKYIEHDFFLDYTKIKYLDKIRPGSKTGDPTVTDIRCMLYLPSKEVKYKLNYKDDWTTLPQKIKSDFNSTLNPQYKKKLSIKADKHKDLVDLFQWIPKKSIPFYQTLVSE